MVTPNRPLPSAASDRRSTSWLLAALLSTLVAPASGSRASAAPARPPAAGVEAGAGADVGAGASAAGAATVMRSPTASPSASPSASGSSATALEKAAEVDEPADVEIQGATKHPIPVVLAPQNVSIITRRQILELNPRDISELLRLLPGVDVFEKQAGEFEASALGSNRDNNNRMVVLIDGKPVMNPQFGNTVWRQLPVVLDAIDRIEVIKGPSSAQYGANAFAGVINIVTDQSDPLSNRGARSRTSVGDQDYFSQTLRAAEWKHDQGFTLNLRYWQEDGLHPLRSPTGDVVPGYEDIPNAFEKFTGVFDYEKSWGPRTRLSARAGLVHNNGHSFDITSELEQPGTTHTKDRSLLLSLDLFHQINDRRAVLFKAQSNQYTTDYDRPPFFSLLQDSRPYQSDRFTELELQGRSDLGRSRYVYGVTYRNSQNDGVLIRPPRQHVDTLTEYSQLEYEFDKKNEGFLGLLFYQSSMNGFDYSPKLSFLHKLSDTDVLRAGWGRSFRAPEGVAYFLNQFRFTPMRAVVPGVSQAAAGLFAGSPLLPAILSTLQASRDNTASLLDPTTGAPSASGLGNPDLGNEHLQQFDLGFEHRNEHSVLKLDLWHAESTDLILLMPTGRAVVVRSAFTPSGDPAVDALLNRAFGLLPAPGQIQFQTTSLRQISQGVTLEAGRTLSRRVRVDGNVTYQDVELKGYYVEGFPRTGRPLDRPPFSPRGKANLILRLTPDRRNTITFVGHATTESYSATSLTRGLVRLPGYATLDLALLHELDPGTNLNVSVKNVFDRLHSEFIASLDATDPARPFGGFPIGRTWIATLSRRF